MKNSISTLKLEAEDHNFNDNLALYGNKNNLEVIFLNKTLVNLTLKLNFIFQNPYYREDLQSYERNLNFSKTVQ